MNAIAAPATIDTPDLVGPPRKWMGEIRHNMGGKKGQKFENDGSYASVESALTRLAIRCFARVEAMGLAMEFADVRAEMDEYYVRAFRAWNPERGVKFNSYLTTACINNFNHRIEKMVEERRELGMFSYDGTGVGSEDGEDNDALDRLESIEDGERPEDRLIARQNMRERLKGLTPVTQRFVAALLLSQTQGAMQGSPASRFSRIAASAGIYGAELKRVRAEIVEKFGAEW